MMTTWERFKRTYEHKEADRVPIIDGPWRGTIRRWQREGMLFFAGFTNNKPKKTAAARRTQQ